MSVSPAPGRQITVLPSVRTSLLGRDVEVDELERIVTDEAVRLVTVSGPGGVGKTRLALHVTTLVRDGWDGDVVFVPLASIRDPRLVPLAIGQAYGLLNDPDDTYESGLVAFLGDRRSLLVLDNLEQVLDAAPVLQRVLDACPAITILATSQVALGIEGERVYPLAPLPTLDPVTAEPHALVSQDAFALFVDRARSINPALELTTETVRAVAEICHHLNGLPLAIELAAARSNVLSPQTLLERLDNQLRLLAQDRGDVPERQRTMRAAVSWSYNLLDPVEQAFFRWLSVFSGGFSVDAATAMFTPGGSRTAVDVLDELVSRSLLQREPDDGRYLMLESMRSYGQEQLEALGEEHTARLVHAGWVASFAEEAEPALQGPDQLHWLRRVDAEMENIRAAVAWSRANDRAGLVLRLAGSLWHYFLARGLVAEGRQWLEEGLVTNEPATMPYRAKGLNALGHLAWDRRDLDVAYRSFTQARILAEASGDRVQEIDAVYGLGHVAHIRNQYADAVTLYEEGIARALALEDQRQVVVGQSNLGLAAFFQGKWQEAIRHWETAAEAMRPMGDLSGEALMLSNIGSATIRLGDLPNARDYITRALEIQRMLGTRARLLSTMNNLAIIHIQLGELDLATEVFMEAMQMHREDGDIAGQAQIAHGLSNLELERKDIRAAAAWFMEAIQLLSRREDPSGIFDYTALLATICEEGGWLAEMVEVLAADARLRRELDFRTLPEDMDDIERTLARARTALGQSAYDAAWAAGAPLDMPALWRRMTMIARQIVGRQVESPVPVIPALPETDTILTPRELDVVRLLAEGKSTAEMAVEMSVSARTVTTHVSNIFEKLDVSSRPAVVARAMREGWV